MRRVFPTLMGALAAAALPALASAQQAGGEPPPPEHVQAWCMETRHPACAELQRIQERLSGIHDAALDGDESLRAEGDALGDELQRLVNEADPDLAASIERVRTFGPAAREAEQRGDTTAIEGMMREMMEIEMRLRSAQAQAFQRAEFIRRVEAYEERMESAMTELDPEAPALFVRLSEIQREIMQAMRAGG